MLRRPCDHDLAPKHGSVRFYIILYYHTIISAHTPPEDSGPASGFGFCTEVLQKIRDIGSAISDEMIDMALDQILGVG